MSSEHIKYTTFHEAFLDSLKISVYECYGK